MHEKRPHSFLKPQSINKFEKSLIVNYLLFNTPVEEYLILSSKRYADKLIDKIKREENQSRQNVKIDERFEIANLEYKSKTSGLIRMHRLNILSSIEEQDLVSWELCFNEVSRASNWTEETKMEVLSQIIDLNIQSQIEFARTSNEVMNRILKLKYNTNTVYNY
ncbi:hypothetical protein DMUE_2085 [Dictyocoela muelleri]|nr:hypothetical protein DMUE_2085 [Dictyocoela muelleri]